MQLLKRALIHIWHDKHLTYKALSPTDIEKLEQELALSETLHHAEICLCIEASMPSTYFWHAWRQKFNLTQIIHTRALDLFGRFKVWDTEQNNGMLVYIQLLEKRIEIITDRGIYHGINPDIWQEIISNNRHYFKQEGVFSGAQHLIQAITDILKTHYPNPSTKTQDELSNRPILL